MNARYTFSKSIDDASSFGGVGGTVAQNWLDLAAERGLSSFNRTHVFTMSWVYTSPFGNPNSRYASSGWAGRLLRNWSLSGGVTAETGTPLTARVLGNDAQLAQTGGIGSERADATGLPVTTGCGFFNHGRLHSAARGPVRQCRAQHYSGSRSGFGERGVRAVVPVRRYAPPAGVPRGSQ